MKVYHFIMLLLCSYFTYRIYVKPLINGVKLYLRNVREYNKFIKNNK